MSNLAAGIWIALGIFFGLLAYGGMVREGLTSIANSIRETKKEKRDGD